MSARLALLLLAVLGCHKRRSTVEPLVLEPHRAAEVEMMRVEGPTRWTAHDGSVCLDVPAGWSGWLGGGDALLALEHGSGVSVSLLRGNGPGSRPGFLKVFEDQGTYRDVPALYPASTVTWISELPGGPTIQEWTGTVDERVVRLEVRYPWGAAVHGRQVADDLLTGLCRP